MKTWPNWKWEIQHRVLERWTICFSSYKNYELKVTLWLVGALERKRSSFSVTIILPKENFVWVLSQYIVYWINILYVLLHCVNCVRIPRFSGLYFPAFKLYIKKPRKTPNADTFLPLNQKRLPHTCFYACFWNRRRPSMYP